MDELTYKRYCDHCNVYVTPVITSEKVTMTEKGIEFTYLENSSSCPHCHCRLYDADESDKNAVRRSSEYWKAKCKLLELERRKSNDALV